MAKDDALNERLRKLRENLNEFSQGIISSNKKLIKSFDSFAEKIKASLTKHTEAVKSSTTSVKSFGKNLDKLTPNLKNITDAAKQSSKSLQGIKKVSDSLTTQANATKKVKAAANQSANVQASPKTPPPITPQNKTAAQPGDQGPEREQQDSGSNDALRYFMYGVIGNQFSKVGKIFAEVNDLVKQSLASNTTLTQQVTLAQYSTANRMGISLTALTKEVIDLREVGFRDLDSSVIKLIGRFKATGQSTEGLQRFLGANSVALGRSKEESQKLLVGIEQSARQYGARADQLVDFASKLTESLEVPALLGFGNQIQQGISLLAAKTGGRGQDSLEKFANFLLDANNQMSVIALGLQDNVAELQRATSSEQAAKILADAAKEAATVVSSRTSDIRGGGSVDILRAQSVLESLGGKQALAAVQVTKALEEQNSALKINNDNLWNLGSVFDALLNPLVMVGSWISSLLNMIPKSITSPILQLVGGIASFFALVGSLKIIHKLYTTAVTTIQYLRQIAANTAISKASAASAAIPDASTAKGVEAAMNKVSKKAPGAGQIAANKVLSNTITRSAGGLVTKLVPTLLRAIPFVGLGMGLISAGMDIYSSIKEESKRKEEEVKNLKRQQMEKNLGSSILFQLGNVVNSMAGGSADADRTTLMKAQLDEMRNLNRNLSSMRNLPDKSGIGVGK